MADLKTLLGDAFKDGMTVEEINAALTAKNFVDPTSLPPSVGKEVFDRTASELAKLKKDLAAKMTDEEATKAAQEAVNSQMAELQKKVSIYELKTQLMDKGYDAKNAEELAKAYADGDMAKFVKVNGEFLTQKETALQASIKAELLKATPGLGGGAGGSGPVDYTKEIQAAQERGDMPAVAALIREQTLQNKKE